MTADCNNFCKLERAVEILASNVFTVIDTRAHAIFLWHVTHSKLSGSVMRDEAINEAKDRKDRSYIVVAREIRMRVFPLGELEVK